MARPQTHWRAHTPGSILPLLISIPLLLLIMLAAATTCSAGLHEFPEYGISIDIPDTGWIVTRAETPLKKAVGKLLLTGSSQKTSFKLIVISVPTGNATREDVHDFVHGMKTAGAKDLDTVWETVDGFDVLSCSYKMDIDAGKTSHMRTLVIMATGRFYALTFTCNMVND